MRAQRLLIAESNEDLRLLLSRELQAFHYVRCCGTGMEALRILRQEKPDMLILNMLLPELDGLTLLETIAAENIRPMVLALTSYRSDYLEDSASRLGVSCILLKPFSLETIVMRALDMKQHLNALPPRPTPESLLQQLLQPLSIRPEDSHYAFVTDAILTVTAASEFPQCKVLYREIAKRHSTTVNTVESGIRHLLDSAWSQQQWDSCFPGLRCRPSNKVFLQKMSSLLRQAMEDSGL